MLLNIKGRIPSKKNSKQVVCTKGRRLVLPSKAYVQWHKEALIQLQEQKVPQDRINSRLIISVLFIAPDKRKFDLSNKFESIADLLVDYGFIEDDNYTILNSVQISFGGVHKESSGAYIDITMDDI